MQIQTSREEGGKCQQWPPIFCCSRRNSIFGCGPMCDTKSLQAPRVNSCQPHQVPHVHQPAMSPQRRVLGEISHNIVRRTELNPIEWGKIVDKVEDGLSQRQISEVLGVSKYTINDALQIYLSTPTKGQSSLRSVRPMSIDVRTERRIIRFVRTAPDAEYSEIKNRPD